MDASDPKLGTSVDGRYRLDERLAAGGMGVVYKAEQVGIGKPVAVKFLHEAFAGVPDLVRRFQREVTAMSRVAHPHLVSVIDSGVQAGVPYLVMDFQSGKPLAEILDAGALPAARAVGIARQVLAGVGHAHASGVVHRDLKPDNIILLGDVGGDFVKILDFGLAKMVSGSGAGVSQLTSTGFALGTPGYMSPEQARGSPADERADLYSVGVILYHMVVGQKPFVSDSPMAVLRMHMDDPPAPPRKAAKQRLSAELDAAILRALEKDPAKRWPSASEFARALEATPEGRASGVPLVDVSMEEVVDEKSRTAIGHKRIEGARPASRRLAKLVLLALVAGGLAFGWSRLSRREQKHVRQKIDDAVTVARGAWQSLTEPVRDVPPPIGNPATNAPVEKNAANAPVEKNAANAPVEKKAANAPVEKNAVNSPVEKTAVNSPVEKNAVNSPVEKTANPPVEKTAVNSPVEKTANPPVEKTANPPVEKTANPPVEKTANPPVEKTANPPVEKTANGPQAVASADPSGAHAATHEEEADDEEDDGSDEAAPPSDTPGARLEAAARAAETQPAGDAHASDPHAAAPHAAPPDAPRPDAPHGEPKRPAAAHPPDDKHRPPARHVSLQDAERLLAAGKLDDAIQALYEIRRHAPQSPAVALLLGHAYFHKLWRTDGLREYATALQLSPGLRRDHLLIHNAVGALEGPTFRLARTVIRRRIGAAALPEVRRAARDGKTKMGRRAARLAVELAHPAKKRRR